MGISVDVPAAKTFSCNSATLWSLPARMPNAPKHRKVWDPQPDTLTPAGPDPPLPQGGTLSLTNHPVPDIAHKKARYKTGLLIFGSGGALCELYANRD
jgi:hypothetical protein